MTPTLHIPIGIPGCGKSTWARRKRVLSTSPSRYSTPLDVVSSDEIRKEFFVTLKSANDPKVKADANASVFRIFHQRIADMLQRGHDVVADATNLTSDSRRKLRDIASDQGAEVHYVFFDNIAQAVEQNRQRDEDAIVPDHVMDAMVMKHTIAGFMIQGEGFDRLTVLSQ